MIKHEQNYSRCDVCGHSRPYGPYHYELRLNHTYGIMVCDHCNAANPDGWPEELSQVVTRKLVAQGRPLPARNKRGLLPRE